MKTAHLVFAASLPLLAACGTPDIDSDEANITSGTAAQLQTKTYKAEDVKGMNGAKCTYDVSWATVANLTGEAGLAANAVLYLGPKAPLARCDVSMTIGGGNSSASVNSANVLSVVYYHYKSVRGSFTKNYVSPANINLVTGKRIALSEIVTGEGLKSLVASCRVQWKKVAAAEGDNKPFLDACDRALAAPSGADPTVATEAFSITKEGIVVHIDNQLDVTGMAEAGFLVKWSALGTGLKAGSPVKGLANR